MNEERNSSPLSTLSDLEAASTSNTKTNPTTTTTTTRLTRSHSQSPSQSRSTPPVPTHPNRRSSLRSSTATATAPPTPTTSQPSTTVARAPKVPSRQGTASIRRSDRERRDKQKGEDVCNVCTPPGTVLTAEQEKANQDKVWIQCEHHWHCINVNTRDSPQDYDKWYCPTCIKITEGTKYPLTSTRRPVPRRTNRAAPKIDYANLDAHLPADHLRWQRVIATRKILPANFPKLRPERLNEEWLFSDGTWSEPIIVESPRGLAMQMPDPSTSISAIADEIGGDHPIEALDVAAQDRDRSIKTLRQWADYFENPRRDKVRNVISLEVGSTPFGEKILAPELVRKLDWVDNIWPKDCREEGQYPQVQKYCLMSVAESWTARMIHQDWHIDFAGSSVFYHILRGGKVFYFIRPTKENLKAYETWSGNTDRQEANWLGDHVDAVYRVELVPGNTMFIPSGWIHAVETPSDSLVIGGNFVHSLNIETQLEVYRIELATKVPKKFRFPHFVTLLWHVANHYTTRLTKALASSTSMRTWPAELRSRRVLLGLKQTSEFLIEQTTRWAKGTNELNRERRRVAIHNVPSTYIKNANELSREFRQVVLRALGEPMDRLCELSNDATSLTWISPEELRAEAMAKNTTTAVSTPKGKITNGRIAAEAASSTTPVMNGHGDAGIKRKASEALLLEDAAAILDPNVSATRAKKPRITPSGMTAVPNDAPTILENTTPYERRPMRMQQMMDPKRADVGFQLAVVNESSNTKTTVKRWEEGGRVYIDVRRMVTTIERVEFGVPPEEIAAHGAGIHGEAEIEVYGTAGPSGSSRVAVVEQQHAQQANGQDLSMEVDQNSTMPTPAVASTSLSNVPTSTCTPASTRASIVLAEAPADPFPARDPYNPVPYKLSQDPNLRVEQMERIVNTYNDASFTKSCGFSSSFRQKDGSTPADDYTDDEFYRLVIDRRPEPREEERASTSGGARSINGHETLKSRMSFSVTKPQSTSTGQVQASTSTLEAPVATSGSTAPENFSVPRHRESDHLPMASLHMRPTQPIMSSPATLMSYMQQNQAKLDSVAPRPPVLPAAQS
ncbi:BQ2448_1494 [Microbotryum intermedium]|uniref:JmjC domain-containing histone demethylation protein 1 n=1 Tax=Microbotryum intermedium TaxID=269621 RepID=A0A238F8C3_9BASI|nr:BQ2448_1494 [Microbotryum intermedium]